MNCYSLYRSFLVLLVYTLAWPVFADEPTGSRVLQFDAPIEFNRDIRPILSEHCFACHGLDANHREADLRLDTFEGATDSGAIVPGNPGESELLRRMVTTDEDEIMPPPETEKRLTPSQIELVERWIAEGAAYQDHWAWQPLSRPGPPELAGNRAKVHPIDAFLAAGWREHSATPVAQADPRDLIRRLSFDLRGIPPSPEDVFEFQQDPSENAFLDIRDRWMSELSYAEHQSVAWLDLVRWADTSGFVSDEPIASGAYRAWIIESFRNNMPFDQFSIEQLAGDLLPSPSDSQLIASGYNRIVNTNCEAGAIELEQLYKLKGEHVRAVGTVWLGLTTGCAECHDHKFDPISSHDYYSLAAFFDDLLEAGVYTPGDYREPLHYVHKSADASQRDRALMAAIRELKQRVASQDDAHMASWEKHTLESLDDKRSRGEFVWVPARLPAPRVLEGEIKYREFESGEIGREVDASPGEFRRHHAAEFITGYLHSKKQKTDSQDAWFVDVWLDKANRPELLGFQVSHGDYGRLGWRTENYETYYWGNDSGGELTRARPWNDPKRVKRLGDIPGESGWVRLRVPLSQEIKQVSGQAFESVGMAWFQVGGKLGWGNSGLELRTDKVTALELGETTLRKWWEHPKNRQVFERRMQYAASSLRTKAADRDSLQQEVVWDIFRERTQPELMGQLRALESELYTLRCRATPVLVSRQTQAPKTTRLLARGDYQDVSGPVVSAAVPKFLGSVSASSSSKATRLDLARWMFEDGQALVARVYVNRLWHHFFGRGITETLEDAGTQGDWPSHLELLNWLACEFRDSGWDRAHMVRLLTSARAYRLNSKPSVDLQQRDPTNRWHARQSRFRLAAESIRDSALWTAGLLQPTEQIPIQSVFPYQPDPYWTRSDKIMFGSRHMDWSTSSSKRQHMRTLYTFWKRQSVHPTLLAFDAPTRQECTAKRNVTNTPGQALALLNDPIFVEAARVLAMRVLDEPADGDRSRLQIAFKMALQRLPFPGEERLFLELLVRQRRHFFGRPEAAEQLTAIGITAPPAAGDAIEVAAWTMVTRTLLNLHEFLNRP